MSEEILINVTPRETRVAILEDDRLVELLVDRPEVAVQWFERVLAEDQTSARARRALIGLGDARVALGDLLGATLVYQDAMKANSTDSIATMASQRLVRLGASAATADSQ